jgi:hypothetical protein
MLQTEKILSFYKKQTGNYFELLINDKKVGSNNSTTEKDPSEENGLTKIEDLLQFVNPGEKVEIKVSTQTNMTSAAILTVYNTDSGQRQTNSRGGSMPGFGGNENNFQIAFKSGYDLGFEAGRREAENKAMQARLTAIENGEGKSGGFNIENITENLSKTEQGQMMLADIMKKIGMLD